MNDDAVDPPAEAFGFSLQEHHIEKGFGKLRGLVGNKQRKTLERDA